jgi:copper chaperone CopZ
METTRFNVQGMSCQGCVASVTRVLKAVPGVTDAAVTLNPGSAAVTYDPARTDVAAFAAAIADAGYAVAP